MTRKVLASVAVALCVAVAAWEREGAVAAQGSAMVNPYRITENWPLYGDIRSGAAIGIIPDGKGGTWLHHRSEPPILHIDASGNITKRFGDKMFVQAHGFCQDRDGNFWAGDSGPFQDNPNTIGRGFQMFKFSPEGKVLLTLGKAGVSRAGHDTFIGPTACAIVPNGDIVIADGHWPRPTTAQQDGDRIVRITKEGKFVSEFGKLGSGSGEFMGPHALAFDSQGRLFVADRSNNRVQIFDRDMNFVDEWRHFGRPSGVAHSEGRHIDRRRLGIEPPDRRPASGTGRRGQCRAESRLAPRHSDRQREGRLASILHSRHQA